MLKLREKNRGVGEYSAPLTLEAANGALRRSFDAEIIDNLRRMTTELAYSGRLPRHLVMTAALRGEGVTHTTLALATTLASDNSDRYCVVDLNWWAPGVLAQIDPGQSARTLQHGRKAALTDLAVETPRALAERPGIAQIVAGEATLDQAIMRTSLPNLCLLPAGELDVRQRPVMARSNSLRSLIDEVRERFDYLLLDVPAILSTSDAIALASLGDACCLVVRHGVTPTPTVQRALDDIKHVNMLGVILNQVAIKTPSWLRMLIPQE